MKINVFLILQHILVHTDFFYSLFFFFIFNSYIEILYLSKENQDGKKILLTSSERTQAKADSILSFLCVQFSPSLFPGWNLSTGDVLTVVLSIISGKLTDRQVAIGVSFGSPTESGFPNVDWIKGLHLEPALIWASNESWCDAWDIPFGRPMGNVTSSPIFQEIAHVS